jgi:uncharacterized protein YcbX
MLAPIVVTELWYYPIKSCKGVRVPDVQPAVFDAKGMVGDRRFMLVNPAGRFLTQREFPQMALIQPTLTDTGLLLSAPAMEQLAVHATNEGESFDAVIWDDVVRVVSQGAEVAAWLSEFLHTPCRLVAMEQGFKRITDQVYSPRPSDHTDFADGFPTLLASENSLDDLNAKLVTPDAHPIPMTRFRPNIVVAGAAAWAEDGWKRVRIGSGSQVHGVMTFEAVKPCGRCIITTTDQETGKRGVEPIPTLKKFRKSSDGAKVLFGQNLTHGSGGCVRVGDVVEVVG